MEKKWEEYTIEEKRELLIYWFSHFSGMPISGVDSNQFKALVDERPDQLFDHIVTNFVYNTSMQSDLLLVFMRDNRVDQILSHSIKPEKLTEDSKESYYRIREFVAGEIVREQIRELEAALEAAEKAFDETPRMHR